MTQPMPAIFFGHGNPLNALERNSYTLGWESIGKEIPKPRAVLCISAHWYVPETAVTAMEAPRTIHLSRRNQNYQGCCLWLTARSSDFQRDWTL